MLNFAALIIFFTRLPLWRYVNVPSEYFKNIIYFWSVAGWLTALVMSGTLYLSSLVFPMSVAVVLAIGSRILLTGALHEDGLADFFDGFGGGTSKERILAIMKDSHTGSYAVIGLIVYYLLLFTLLSSLPVVFACMAILAADPFCKGISSMITLRLSYARKEEESKIKAIYNNMKLKYFVISIVFGLIPFLYVLPPYFYWAGIAPIVLFFILTQFMRAKIQGYTGDCVGALFLLLELSFYMSFVGLVRFI